MTHYADSVRSDETGRPKICKSGVHGENASEFGNTLRRELNNSIRYSNTMKNHFLELEEQVRRLERQNRLLRIAFVIVVLIVVVAANLLPSEEVVRANRFELVDPSGRVRTTLEMSDDGNVGLFVMDDSSRVRLSATHGPDETALFIRDRAGETRVGAAQFAHGGGGFALHGEGLKGATVLYMKNGKGSLRHFDEQGNVTFQVPEP